MPLEFIVFVMGPYGGVLIPNPNPFYYMKKAFNNILLSIFFSFFSFFWVPFIIEIIRSY